MDQFSQFAAEHAEGLLRTAFLLVRDQADAEDLLQETLLRVAGQWPRVQAMEHPLAYTRRVMLNHARTGADQRRRRSAELERRVEPAGATDSGYAEVAAREEILQALAGLPFHQRAVLVLRYFDDLSERQTADALGCSTGAVKTSASRGLAKLRAALSETTPSGEAQR